MQKTLILYSTVDGQTKKIAHYIAKQLQQKYHHHDVEVVLLENFIQQANHEAQLAQYDKVIIGASIRYGKHRKNLLEFINTHKQHLKSKSSAFFSVNLVARKDEKNTASTNPYIRKFLDEVNWQPNVVDVFAGKLDYSLYNIFDKMIIKLIMWMTKGPTKSSIPIEFTNWTRVEDFLQQIATN